METFGQVVFCLDISRIWLLNNFILLHLKAFNVTIGSKVTLRYFFFEKQVTLKLLLS
jgi:hypothetical protein